MTALTEWIAAQRAQVDSRRYAEQSHLYGEALMLQAKSGAALPTALRLVEVLAEEWGKLPCWCHNVDHICSDDEPFIPVPKDWKCHRCVILAECERIVKEANSE